MARKSKGKFDMKGHSIPGIKGFKGDKLKDGRHGSSALQMKSPLEQDDSTTKLDFNEEGIASEYDKAMKDVNKPAQYSGKKEGWGWAAFELAQLAKRRKANKAKETLAEQEELDRLNEEAIDQSHLENEYQQSGVYDENLDEFGNPLYKNVQKDIDIEGYSSYEPHELPGLKAEIEEIGTWDPENNPDHAEIQRKIDEAPDLKHMDAPEASPAKGGWWAHQTKGHGGPS